jgi:hypothetical protein
MSWIDNPPLSKEIIWTSNSRWKELKLILKHESKPPNIIDHEPAELLRLVVNSLEAMIINPNSILTGDQNLNMTEQMKDGS